MGQAHELAEHHVDKEVNSVFGQDLGASTSKGTLSCSTKTGRAQIYRISSHLPWKHPQSAVEPSATPFELPSFAALRDDGLHVGMTSRESDQHFQLKHFLLYCAGITHERADQPIPGMG